VLLAPIQPPCLPRSRTWREIEEIRGRLQLVVTNDTEVDTAGQCRAVFGAEIPGETDVVRNTMGRV
jgi:hypothetical protein